MSEKDQSEGDEGAKSDSADLPHKPTDQSDNSSQTASEQSQPELEDVTEFVTDRKGDMGAKQYFFKLHLEDESIYLRPEDVPAVTVSHTNRLRVKVGNRLYHKAKLKKDVTQWVVSEKEKKKIVIKLDKKKPELWDK